MNTHQLLVEQKMRKKEMFVEVYLSWTIYFLSMQVTTQVWASWFQVQGLFFFTVSGYVWYYHSLWIYSDFHAWLEKWLLTVFMILSLAFVIQWFYCYNFFFIRNCYHLGPCFILPSIHITQNAASSSFFGEGNGDPLQYFCLENPMDGGAWWAAVHGVAKSRT